MDYIQNLLSDIQNIALAAIALTFTIPIITCRLLGRLNQLSYYVAQMWIFILVLLCAQFFSFYLSTWLWGILCFFSLREYFTLVEMRTQDRLAMLAAYLAIPFMMHFIHTDWYSMFIITIPVYAFLVMPFFISLGGKNSDGAVFSIGVIDFGLFLFVYCMGHLAYLSKYSIWMAIAMILCIAVSELLAMIIERHSGHAFVQLSLKIISPIPLTIGLMVLLADWTNSSFFHAMWLGIIIPILVVIGNHTVQYVEQDLKILPQRLRPGRGLILHNMKAVLYSAPIILHYYRYFIL